MSTFRNVYMGMIDIAKTILLALIGCLVPIFLQTVTVAPGEKVKEPDWLFHMLSASHCHQQSDGLDKYVKTKNIFL